MKHTRRIRSLLCLVLVLLLAAAALTLTGCKQQTTTAAPETAQQAEEASYSFKFNVTMPDGEERSYEITTDALTVGEALLKEGLIDGEDGEYGLYVTTVDGCMLDWEADNMYWAFYINGEYATTGVDATPVTDGETYAFVATPG